MRLWEVAILYSVGVLAIAAAVIVLRAVVNLWKLLG